MVEGKAERPPPFPPLPVPSLMTSSVPLACRVRRPHFALHFLTVVCCLSAPSLALAADTARAEKIAAALNIPRRAWTICTVNEIGSSVRTGPIADPTSIADGALARCSNEERALRTKAIDLLGDSAAGHLMQRLEAETRDALIGSARTLLSAKASGNAVDPAWPRVLGPVR